MRCFILLALVVNSMQRCTNPQAENGEHIIEGCLKRTCKSNTWRSSLVSNKCCYDKEAYSINTTIYSSMSKDGCAEAALDCVEETPGIVKTVLSVKNYCEDYASKDQLEEIKEILLEQMEAGSGCQGEKLEANNEKKEQKVLLIGPSSSSYGQSVVLSLADLTPLDCNIPVFPDEYYHSYVGRSTSDGVLMCGGNTRSGITSSCYLLTRSGYKNMTGLLEKRKFTKFVMTPLGLWVTGGFNGQQFLDTTEIWSDDQSRPHVRLPKTMSQHCVTALNNTHVLLTGGFTKSGVSSAAYIYSDKTGFTRIEDMKEGRFGHGCSVINDSTVIVASGDFRSSIEYLDLTSLTWSEGPQLSEGVHKAEMLGPEELGREIGGHFIIGVRKIFKLEEEGLSQKRVWAEVGDMKYRGENARAFVVNRKMFC